MIMIASESTQCYWQMLTRDSKHRAAPAGLFATADEPTSYTFLVPCIRDARVPQQQLACVRKAASACTCYACVTTSQGRSLQRPSEAAEGISTEIEAPINHLDFLTLLLTCK